MRYSPTEAIREIERTAQVLLEIQFSQAPKEEALFNCASRLQKASEALMPVIKERNDLFLRVQILEQQLRGFQQEEVKNK